MTKQAFNNAASNRILDALLMFFGFAAGISTIGGPQGSEAALQLKNHPRFIM
jgi:hypothetical protein